MHDVAIIGYGPTGVILANLLGQPGLSIAVIEKDLAQYDRPRAIGIDHESLRTLQSCGLAEQLRGHIQPFAGTRYLGVDGEPIKRLLPVPPPYKLGWPPNATFVQPELEGMLRDATASRSGVHALTGHRLMDMRDQEDGIELQIEEVATGRQQKMSARYVVGCDGASSTVRRHIGGPVEDLDFDEWWVVVDALLLDRDAVPATGCHYCWPSRPVSYVLGPRNLRRWELKLLPGEDPEAFRDRDLIVRTMTPHVPAAAIDIWRTAVYRFHAIVAQDWARGRAFIAGDAAHQMPPFLGQGMNSGIRDAANLAWKLLAVLRDGAPPTLLDTYAEERKPHVRTITALAKGIGLVIGELNHEAAVRRDAALREEMARGEAVEIRQAYIPPLTCGLLADTPGAGELFVQPLVKLATGEERWLDDLLGPRFLIATADPLVPAWLDQAARAAWVRIGGRVALIQPEGAPAVSATAPADVTALELGEVFLDRMVELGCAAVVVRPDHYVFGTACTQAELRRLVHEVTQLMHGGSARAGALRAGPRRTANRKGDMMIDDRGQTYQSVWRHMMTTSFRQGYLTAGGLRTRYVQAGRDDAPALVMLHGTGGHWETFCANIGPLSEHFNCYAIDMLGCGFTDKPDKPYEISTYIEHVLAFMDEVGLKSASIIGVSLGSWVATRLALAYPERVEKLIMIAPPGLLPLRVASASTIANRTQSAANPSWDNISKVLGHLFFDEKKSLMDDLVAVRQRVYSLPGIDRIMPRMLTLFDAEIRERNNLSEAEWRSIDTPVLIVAHVDAPDLYLETADKIFRLLPNAQRVELRQTSHWSHFEDPATFNSLALRFLQTGTA